MISGKELADDRLFNRISQSEMARAMNVSQQYISRVEYTEWVSRGAAARYRATINAIITARLNSMDRRRIVRVFKLSKSA